MTRTYVANHGGFVRAATQKEASGTVRVLSAAVISWTALQMETFIKGRCMPHLWAARAGREVPPILLFLDCLKPQIILSPKRFVWVWGWFV